MEAQTAGSSWFARLSTALPSVAEAAAAASAGDLNALSKAASNAQQGLQQGLSELGGKAKGMAKQASTTISENAISKERPLRIEAASCSDGHGKVDFKSVAPVLLVDSRRCSSMFEMIFTAFSWSEGRFGQVDDVLWWGCLGRIPHEPGSRSIHVETSPGLAFFFLPSPQ